MARPKSKLRPTAEDAIKLFELHPDYPRIQVRMRERMDEVRRNMSPAARGFLSRERLEHVLRLLDICAESFCELVSDNRAQNAFMVLLHRMELDTYQEYTGWPIGRLRQESDADIEAIHAKTQWWTKKGYERLEKLSDAGRKITRKQIWTAAGKPTTPNPADLGLLVPGTEEHDRIQEALEANWKAEQADPERRRKNQRRNADLQAAYDRRSELPGWRYSHEKLIRDARKYAESCLAKARSPNARLKVTRRALKECIGRLPNSPEFPLSFEDLHTAIWTEGNPSLEERANECAIGTKAEARAEEPACEQASTEVGGSGIPADPVAADRAALLTAYKAKGRGKGVRITDEMVAKAANPGKWNDRTMVTWWKRNDQRCKPPNDRKIRAVLAKDPSDVWSPRIKSKHPPK